MDAEMTCFELIEIFERNEIVSMKFNILMGC